MVRFELQASDGVPVGWVEFNPYKYEYTGDMNGVRNTLEAGPPQHVQTGSTAEIPGNDDGEGDVQSNVEDRQENKLVQTDKVREASEDERITTVLTKLKAYGVSHTKQ